MLGIGVSGTYVLLSTAREKRLLVRRWGYVISERGKESHLNNPYLGEGGRHPEALEGERIREGKK